MSRNKNVDSSNIAINLNVIKYLSNPHYMILTYFCIHLIQRRKTNMFLQHLRTNIPSICLAEIQGHVVTDHLQFFIINEHLGQCEHDTDIAAENKL